MWKVEWSSDLIFLLLKSIYAGIAIGIGGLLYLSVQDKIIAAALFSIGLIAVLVFNLELYTGRVCYLEKNPCELPIVWAGNYIGATFLSEFNIVDTYDLAISKMNKSVSNLFISGIICGLCVAIAVKGYRKTNNLFIPVLGVIAFILVGGEHCVADMFYFSLNDTALVPLLIITLGNTIGGMAWGALDYFK